MSTTAQAGVRGPVAVALGSSLAAMVALQFGTAIAATAFDRVGPVGMNSLRVVVGAVVLLLIVRPRLRGRSAADLRMALCFGVGIAAMNLSMYLALARIPLGIAVSVSFLGPLSVAVVGSRRAADLAWPALAAVGVVLLADPAGGSTDLAGIGFALLTAALWALYIQLSAHAGARFGGVDGLAIAIMVAATVLTPIGLAAGGDALLDPQVLIAGALSGVLTVALGYRLETEALRRISTRLFGIFTSLEPAVATAAGIAVLSQALAPREALGITLVIAACAGASLLGSAGSGRRDGPAQP